MVLCQFERSRKPEFLTAKRFRLRSTRQFTDSKFIE